MEITLTVNDKYEHALIFYILAWSFLFWWETKNTTFTYKKEMVSLPLSPASNVETQLTEFKRQRGLIK